jgi:hypothetical protein
MPVNASLKHLADEIFILTGQKVDSLDPVIVAALFQSKLLGDAHKKSLDELNGAVQLIIGDVNNSIEHERSKLAIILKAQDTANLKMAIYAKSVLRSEIPKIREEFHEVAIDVLKEANGFAANNLATKLLAVMPVVVLLAALGGFFFGKYSNDPAQSTVSMLKSLETKTAKK